MHITLCGPFSGAELITVCLERWLKIQKDFNANTEIWFIHIKKISFLICPSGIVKITLLSVLLCDRGDWGLSFLDHKTRKTPGCHDRSAMHYFFKLSDH